MAQRLNREDVVMMRILVALLLGIGPVAADEQALDATLCRKDHPGQCVCMTLIVEGQDAAVCSMDG